MYTEIEEKLSSVEAALAQFIIHSNRNFHILQKEMKDFKDEMKDFKDEMKDFKDEMKDFKDEMKDFKDEMKDFKDEMKDFKDEMKDFKDEMKDFKDEMKDFKDEMKDFKDEMKADQKARNKEWGELANKMGTLVEDIIAPAVRPVLSKYFEEEIDYLAVNVQKKDKTKNIKGEFDVIAASSTFVFLVDTKSRPKKEHLEKFTDDVITRFQALFPEFSQKTLIPVFASLRFEEPFISLASRKKVYLLAYREWEYMDIINFSDLNTSSVEV